ncbi:uncharacterized protein N7459_001690 [Penicillium hispanicum]|uniref:uncharacterized protein n=1 Tax=Penicillium hispanicum TaxID=1080232 RepID=UPI00253FC434|nr:uncharacterized protein N7459_001690 [Penicillium hispanicum]KAJ5595482.1 hypothetical protein N7459_001690 [Penicillium hispanicum]
MPPATPILTRTALRKPPKVGSPSIQARLRKPPQRSLITSSASGPDSPSGPRWRLISGVSLTAAAAVYLIRRSVARRSAGQQEAVKSSVSRPRGANQEYETGAEGNP